jgi:putative DNA primase/helicase
MQLGLGLTDKALMGRDAPCPACGGKDRFRFSNRDGRGTWYCHGCREGGGGVGLVMAVKGLSFAEAARLIEGVLGGPVGYTNNGDGADRPKDPLKPYRDAYPDIFGTAVETYQRARGHILTVAEAASLRFHPAMWHWPTKSKWPAMVAAVARWDGTTFNIVSCHQTFLQVDGSGKAPVERPKLFPSGANPAGGGVWFNSAGAQDAIVVAEGIESTLSAMRLCGVLWGCAALSDSGIRSLVLPPQARKVRIFADNDELQQGVAAAVEAARRWRSEGREVGVVQAARDGEDANDVWLRRLRASAAGAPP